MGGPCCDESPYEPGTSPPTVDCDGRGGGRGMSERMTAVSAVLEDGGQVNIRQANAGDESALAAF